MLPAFGVAFPRPAHGSLRVEQQAVALAVEGHFLQIVGNAVVAVEVELLFLHEATVAVEAHARGVGKAGRLQERGRQGIQPLAAHAYLDPSALREDGGGGVAVGGAAAGGLRERRAPHRELARRQAHPAAVDAGKGGKAHVEHGLLAQHAHAHPGLDGCLLKAGLAQGTHFGRLQGGVFGIFDADGKVAAGGRLAGVDLRAEAGHVGLDDVTVGRQVGEAVALGAGINDGAQRGNQEGRYISEHSVSGWSVGGRGGWPLSGC